MPKLKNSLPKYRKHRASGQAVVTLKGRDFYLGPHGTKASHYEYDRLIGEYLASGRSLPVNYLDSDDITVVELCARFMRFAKGHYQKNGRPTQGENVFRWGIPQLKRLYGRQSVSEFGPIALKTVRQAMIDDNISRGTINDRVGAIVRIFKWGVAEELVPPAVLQSLQAVQGLQKGRTEARESVPVRLVSDEAIEATLPHLPPIVASMVRLQRLTGMRPNEIVQIRPIDVNLEGDVWSYRPHEHKTEHHERDRIIFIGPQAQGILGPYLDREPEAYCFDPRESEKLRRIDQRRRRKTKVQPSQQDRHKTKPKRTPKEKYSTTSYRRAIHRACDNAKIERWSPNRLRHAAATEIRSKHGIEAAKVILGHSNLATSLIYAEDDLKKAESVAREIG
jgi:integrase